MGHHRVAALPTQLSDAQDRFVELFPRAQAGKGHRRAAPISLGHPVGQIEDLHGAVHVEEENLPGMADHCGLEHELTRLRDGHEVPGGVRVRHRHRMPGGALHPEGIEHRAPAPQDVAEADRDEREAGLVGRPRRQPLGHPLGEAEDTRRVDGLVTRYVHESTTPRADRGFEDVERAPDVGLQRLDRIALEQRQVLEGSGMEDHVKRALYSHTR